MHIVIAALHRPIKPTGVCRHAANLARCLAEKPEVTKISLIIGSWQQHYFETAFNLDFEKIKLVPVNIKNSSVVRNLWFILDLPKLANELQADVVHLSFPLPFIRGKFNAPVVTTIHDLYPYECPENFGFPKVWFNRMFLRQAIRNSNGLSCVSRLTSDRLKFYFPNLKTWQKVDVIYNYVDFEGIETEVPSQIAEDSRFLLCVAQHRRNKNLDLLIKAFHRLLTNQKIASDCQLVIVGSSGPETEKIQSLIIELNLVTKVSLLSGLGDRQLCWLYQHCQAFIIPSAAEGFCLPLAEALHFSDRVVCSDIPIFREIATDRCAYFSLEGDAVARLEEAVVKTIARPSSLDRDYLQRFNKANIARQYLNLYSWIDSYDLQAFANERSPIANTLANFIEK